MRLVIDGRAEIVEADADRVVRSERLVLPRPAVIRLMRFVHVPRRFRRQVTNTFLFARDRYRCQCGGRLRLEVIQGGSPGASEYVGSDRYFRDELGTVPHLRGTVGMSTRGHDTGDAQWFMNLRDNLRLGRDYTVFAEVVEGMEVVDGILEGDVIATIAR